MLWTLPVPIIHQKFFLAYANLVVIIAILNIPEEGQFSCRKLSLSNFLLIVNNANTGNKPKNVPDFMVAVYCYSLVQKVDLFAVIMNTKLHNYFNFCRVYFTN